MARRKTHDEFVSEIFKLFGDEYGILGRYVQSHEKLSVMHNKCSTKYMVTPNALINGKGNCPTCGVNKRRKTTEQFKAEVFELAGTEYDVLGDYLNNKKKIKMRHNHCDTIYFVSPSNFLKGDRCPDKECKGNKISEKVKKSHSQFLLDVFILVENEYNVLGIYRGENEKILMKHMECGHEWPCRPKNFLKKSVKTRCPICSRIRMIHEEYEKELNEKYKNRYILFTKYERVDIKIHVKCNDCCSDFWVRPDSLLKYGSCKTCSNIKLGNIKRKTQEEFEQEIYNIVKNEYIVLGKYLSTHEKVLMRHDICNNEWEVNPNSFLQGSRCPVCNESKGEKRVRSFLDLSNINFEPQYKFNNLKGLGGNLLKFDFAIFDKQNNLSLLIEYDGEFHYNKIYEDDGYEIIVEHDNRKNTYCELNNIPLLRIPHWDFNNIEEILKVNLLNSKSEQKELILL